MTWDSKAYPLGCRSCGKNTTSHQGRGLCSVCYRKDDIREAALDGTLVEFDFSDRVLEDVTDPVSLVDEMVPGSRRPSEPVQADAIYQPADGVLGKMGFKKKVRGSSEEKKKAPTTSETKPKRGKRLSAADSFADVWGIIGGAAGRVGFPALARCLEWQGPSAGEMLDQAVAGTFVDRRLLQPAIMARGRLDLVGAIIGPPALVFQIERNPRSAHVLLPMLKASIRNSLPTMIPAMKLAQEKAEKVAEVAREVWPDLPSDMDPADAMLVMMFGQEFFIDLERQAADAAREAAADAGETTVDENQGSFL